MIIIVCLLLIVAGIAYFVWKYPNLRKAWFFLPRKGLVALMYHHIKEEPSNNPADYAFAIAPDVFEQQLDFLHTALHLFLPSNCSTRKKPATNTYKNRYYSLLMMPPWITIPIYFLS